MGARGQRGRGRRRRTLHFLEQTSASQIRSTKSAVQALLAFHWKYYSELAYQRAQIEEQLLAALCTRATQQFPFAKWQRAVKYRYALHPLCTNGSLADPGGRFNVGDIDPVRFPTFPALYLAADKDTALQETLGQGPTKNSALTPRELALTRPDSEAIVSVSGQIDRVLDLRTAQGVESFVALIKGFTLSKQLRATAARLQVPLILIQTPAQLLDAVLNPEFRVAHIDSPFDYIVAFHGYALGWNRDPQHRRLADGGCTYNGIALIPAAAQHVTNDVEHQHVIESGMFLADDSADFITGKTQHRVPLGDYEPVIHIRDCEFGYERAQRWAGPSARGARPNNSAPAVRLGSAAPSLGAFRGPDPARRRDPGRGSMPRGLDEDSRRLSKPHLFCLPGPVAHAAISASTAQARIRCRTGVIFCPSKQVACRSEVTSWSNGRCR